MKSVRFAVFATACLLSFVACAATPVVFLHGWNSDASIWKPMMKLLKSDAGYADEDFLALSYYDLRDADGHRIDLDTSINAVAKAVATEVAETFPEGEIDFVAHSMGGLVVRAMVTKGYFPADRIAHFVPIASPHYGQAVSVAGKQTEQMSFGSEFIWNLAYAWHFKNVTIPRTLSIVGLGTRIDSEWSDGLVSAPSAALADTPCVYVDRFHADIYSEFGEVIYDCPYGVDDPVYRAVRDFLTEDRVLPQEETGFTPDQTALNRGALLYRVVDDGDGLEFPFYVSSLAKGFWREGYEANPGTLFHGHGRDGLDEGIEQTRGCLTAGIYKIKLKNPLDVSFKVSNVTVEGGRTGVYEFDIDGDVTRDGKRVKKPEIVQDWSPVWKKARTVYAAVRQEGVPYGSATVKVGRADKYGNVKVSASLTGIDGKKVSAKAVKKAISNDTVVVVLSVKYADVSLAIDPEGVAGLWGDMALETTTLGGALANMEDPCVYVDPELSLGLVGELHEYEGIELVPFSGEPVGFKGTKWAFAKAAKLKWAKVKGTDPVEYELRGLDDPKRPNMSGLSLSYNAKTGIFKGSFKVYVLDRSVAKPKLRNYKVSVTGIVVDGLGTGQAVCKKPAAGPWPVTVE